MMRALMTKTLFVLSILLSAQALAFDVGGFSYTVINATDVAVTGRASGNAATDIEIPSTASNGGTDYSVTTIERGAFYRNDLTSVAFLGNFGTFNPNMFQDNTNLTAITYSQGATGWDSPPRTFTPSTGPTGSVTAEAAAAPPATPAAPTATAGDSQASVTWTKPADGGSTITGYTVTSAPDGNTCTTSDADTLTCDVTGLTNGTAYTFSVTATNGVGTSAASAASSSVTPAAPPVPPVPTVATPVPTSPLWLLGIMAGLLYLVGIRSLRKA